MLFGLLGGILLPAGAEEYGAEVQSWFERVLQPVTPAPLKR